jgi:signal transduction histidine kinase
VSIEVTDSGCGGAAAGSGYGITGMRQRAALLGGNFSAGPRLGGGTAGKPELLVAWPPR